jgi:hypothetical protein
MTGGRRRQLKPEVISGDLRVVEVRGTRAKLLEVLTNRRTAGGGLSSVGHCGGGSHATWNNLGSRFGPA